MHISLFFFAVLHFLALEKGGKEALKTYIGFKVLI